MMLKKTNGSPVANKPHNDKNRTMAVQQTWAALRDAARATHLAVLGAFHPEPGEDIGQTVVLLGPDEPHFWPAIRTQPEFQDAAADPVDRWSLRVITALADDLGARAAFPFTGPPYHPFWQWAVRSGRCWPSPIGLLVHDQAGLWVSFRGALVFDHLLPLPDTGASPCPGCTAPCATACPADAFGPDGYNTDACHAHLATPAGQVCVTQGCQSRAACPVSQTHPRAPDMSAFFMQAFRNGMTRR